MAHSLDIQTVGSDDVWLPLDEVLRLLGRDVTDGREDVSEVGGRPLQAVSVVDLPLARLYVHVEVLEVVIEVHGSSTQVSAQESGVSREYGGHLHLPQAQQPQPEGPLQQVSTVWIKGTNIVIKGSKEHYSTTDDNIANMTRSQHTAIDEAIDTANTLLQDTMGRGLPLHR